MTKQTIETEPTQEAPAPAEEPKNLKNTHYLDYEPNEKTGVIESETYHFPGYTVGGRDATMEGDIKHLFAKGFDATPYDFNWAPYTKVDEYRRRYFIPCRPETHKKWFHASAWDPNLKAIACGWDPRAARKELILMVRPKKAKQQEDAAMLALSQDKNDPDKGEQVQGAVDNIRGRAGDKYLRVVGGGVTHTKGRWN